MASGIAAMGIRMTSWVEGGVGGEIRSGHAGGEQALDVLGDDVDLESTDTPHAGRSGRAAILSIAGL
jgi:hypothetical protein